MNNLRKLLERVSKKSSIINALAGILLVLALVIIYRNPNNQFAILTACIAGGIMNMMFGINARKDPKRKMTAMSYVLMGVILIGLGFYLIRFL